MIKPIAGLLEIYVATMAYVAVTVGLTTSDYLAVEVGLKAAMVSMFIGAIGYQQDGDNASAISLAIMASVIMVLFYLIGLADGLVSITSYLLLTVLATAASKVSAGGPLNSLLVRGIPTFYSASAYAFLTHPWDSFQEILKIFVACLVIFALLNVITSLVTSRRPLVKDFLYITTRYIKAPRKASGAFKILRTYLNAIYSYRDATPIRTLSAMGCIHQLTVLTLVSGYHKVIASIRAVSMMSDRVAQSVVARILSLTRLLEDKSRGLEVSLGTIVSRVAHAIELLQNSLESSLLLLLFAMSILVLIAIVAYLLLLV